MLVARAVTRKDAKVRTLLRIRKEQVEALSQAVVAQFEERTVDELRATLPAYGLDEEALRELIRQGISDAARYGLISEQGTRAYIGAMLALGESFDGTQRYAWLRAILENPEVNPEKKADRLRAAARRGAR